MRYWVFLLALAGVYSWQQREVIRDWVSPPPPLVAHQDRSVVLFATSWCGYCAKTRALLKRYDIPFLEYDIEKSAEGYAHYQRLGGRGVPVLQIGTRVIHGFDEAAILEALQ